MNVNGHSRYATLMSYQLTKLMNLNATVWSSVGLWYHKLEAEWNLLRSGWNWMNGHEMLNFLCSSIEDFWFSWDSKPLEVKRTRNTLREKLCKKRFRLWLCKFSWNSFCRLPPLSLNVWQSFIARFTQRFISKQFQRINSKRLSTRLWCFAEVSSYVVKVN